MYFPADHLIGIQRRRFDAEPPDCDAVTDSWEYEDGTRDFNEVSDNPPRRWEYGYTLAKEPGGDPPEQAIFDDFYAAVRKSQPFYFTDKYGDTWYPVMVEDYSRTHEAHKPWIKFVDFKLRGNNAQIVALTPPTVGLLSASLVGADVEIDGMVSELCDLPLFINGNYYSTISDNGTFTFSVPLADLPTGAVTFFVRAVKTTGAYADSNSLPYDRTPPVVAITNPAPSATVSGTIPVVATATDSQSAIDRVEFFYYDGAGFAPFATDFTSPYSVNFNTLLVPNGILVLAATAFDAAGNSAAAFVTVAVENEVDFLIEDTGDFLTEDTGDYLIEG